MMEKQRRITKAYFDFARHKYAPLINKLAFRVGANEAQAEEMKSIAIVELLRCMICYNNSSAFMTFLYGRLHDVFRHLRDAEKRAGRIHMMSSDSIANISEPDRDMDTHMVVTECLECLDNEEHYIITELFLNNKTMREISHDSGVVPSTICRVKSRALDKMKKKCEVGLE